MSATPAEACQTACCIVGGGPAGVMLALLLARQNIPVTLLESHLDFDRDFRGDTVHPSTLEILDQIGLADRLLQIPHGEIRSLVLQTPRGALKIGDFSRLRTRFPFVAMIPQVHFLNFLAAEAQRYPSFNLIMGANVDQLVRDGDVVQGVRYRDREQKVHEVRAPVTIAADGRFSRIRHLLGWEPVGTAPPMDVLWLRLPRRPTDPDTNAAAIIGKGRMLVLLDRGDEWQGGYVVPKDGYKEVRAAGLEALRASITELLPWLGDRVGDLRDWNQMAVLSVASNRLTQWYCPGLLLIGDAAHTMSPIGGVGINYAIQDAVESANVLIPKLQAGRVEVADLAEVQRRRQWPTKVIQAFQSFMQRRVVLQALTADKPFRIPLPLRLIPRIPLLRRLPGRMLGFGWTRVRLEHPEAASNTA